MCALLALGVIAASIPSAEAVVCARGVIAPAVVAPTAGDGHESHRN